MRALISATVLALALTACGGGGDDDEADETPSKTSSTASKSATTEPSPVESETQDGGLEQTDYGPSCESMFVEGEIMPKEAIDGCYDRAEDSITVSFTDDCTDGRTLVLNPKGYGIVGEKIHLPAPGDDEPDVNSAEYQAVYDDCLPD